MLTVTQQGIDLVNSGQDSPESQAMTALLNTGQDSYDPNSAVDYLSQNFGVDGAQVINSLIQKGLLAPDQGQQVPSEEFAPPQPQRMGATQEGVPSVLPTQSQTAQAESSGAIPSVLPGRPASMGTPIQAGVKAEQVGAADKFKKLLTPRGIRA